MEMFSGSLMTKRAPMGRCSCPVGDQSVSFGTPQLRALVAPLIDNEGAPAKSLRNEKFHPYKKPGSLPNAPVPFDGKVPTVQRDDSPNATR